MSDEIREIQQALAEPFGPDELGWKPQTVSNNRCLAIPYIDARDVMERLDQVVGPHRWQDSYDLLEGGEVRCRLSLQIGGQWITKEDVGGESDQKDEGDRRKSAFSDALKRAAVKWGIGRYLYRLPICWTDYDPQKKQITTPPRLPDWALPRRPRTASKAPAQSAAGPGETAKKSLAARLEELAARADAAGVQPAGAIVADAISHFAGPPTGLGNDYTAWPEAAADEVMAWASKRYAALVGPLPITAEQVAEIEALLKQKGEKWAKLHTAMALDRGVALKGLSRAQYAQARKLLVALADRKAA